jgi:hypothetical protein
MRAITYVACVCLFAGGCGADEQVRGVLGPSTVGTGGTGGSSAGADGGTLGAGMSTPGGALGGSGGSGTLGGSGSLGGTGAGGAAGGQGGECEQHVIDGALSTPDVLIVLDRSGSMNPGNNDDSTDRWGGSRTALIEVTAALDDQIRFGLMTFPGGAQGGRNDDNECAPGELNVPIDVNTGAAIASTLQGMDADGRTPTAPSLQEALRILNVMSGPDEMAGAKYVLLVTDGDPNCSGGNNDRDDAARQQTLAAIEALTAAGIKTFVVGYQTAGTDFSDQLDRMAAAGGTGTTMHRSVTSGADLTAAMTDIAGRLVSCSYRLDAPVADPTHVLVTVGGRQRNFNQTEDGWTLGADSRTVTLSGAACDDVRNGMLFVVTVTCAPVAPI